uniref:HTH CENPB-type domain-containing protein n=1 Tax=Erpetoichthys calabaricus TaxID=27687 RepID=A0A8C4RS32_ERPCA
MPVWGGMVAVHYYPVNMAKTTRQSYTAKFKLEMITYAKELGNRAAERKFGPTECVIRKWRKAKSTIKEMRKVKRANRGSKAHHPNLEKALIKWIEDSRHDCLGVSTTTVCLQALRLAKEQNIPEFKASMNWCWRFFGRNKLSIRRRTTISQQLPSDHEDQIGNADQTPLTFDLPSENTVNIKGARTITMRSTGNEKNRFTVMLGCMADGAKLPPYVVFKRKTMPKDKFPSGVIVRMQEQGWFNESIMDDWLKTVWMKRDGGLGKQRSMLVLDAFRCHTTDDVKSRLKRHNTDLVIIPSVMTSILQPMDAVVNKPFKAALKKKWAEWMINGEHTFTKGGNMRKVDMPTICQWIVDAWKELPIKTVVKGFKKCCISNMLDGTEDDILWMDDTDDADDDQKEEELDYHDDCIAQQKWDALLNEDSDDED